MGVSTDRKRKPRSLRLSDRSYFARRCDRCGASGVLHVVADDFLCGWCHHQWQKLFNGEDGDGRLYHGPGTRFIPPAVRGGVSIRAHASLAGAGGMSVSFFTLTSNNCLAMRKED